MVDPPSNYSVAITPTRDRGGRGVRAAGGKTGNVRAYLRVAADDASELIVKSLVEALKASKAHTVTCPDANCGLKFQVQFPDATAHGGGRKARVVGLRKAPTDENASDDESTSAEPWVRDPRSRSPNRPAPETDAHPRERRDASGSLSERQICPPFGAS
jgi:hypothetical protein